MTTKAAKVLYSHPMAYRCPASRFSSQSSRCRRNYHRITRGILPDKWFAWTFNSQCLSGMRFNISIAPFKAQKPAYQRVFYFFLNVGYTKPIVEKILSMFFEKCKHHVAIFSKNHLSRHLPQLRFRVCFFLPALCYQFTNDVRIPLIPLIIGQVWYQLLDMTSCQRGR